MDDMKTRIRECRMELGITQRAIGEAIDVTVATVNMWESAGRAPDLASAIKLADFLDVSLDWLVTGQGPKPRNRAV